MLVTVIVVVATRDLSKGVLAGVLLSGIFFAAKVRRMFAVEREQNGPRAIYRVSGQLFFASTTAFAEAFDFNEKLRKVGLDVTDAHFWDTTAINALDKVVIKFRQQGAEVEVFGLNEQSRAIVERLAIYHKPEASAEGAAAH